MAGASINPHYRGLTAIMEEYLSASTVSSTLQSALRRLKLDKAELSPEDLPEVVAQTMIGLRLFCDPARLPDLMVDLAEYCDEATGRPAEPTTDGE